MTKLALLGPKSPHRDLGRLSGVRLEATGGLNFAGIGDAVDKARSLAAQYACPVGQHYDTTLGKCVPDAEQYGPPVPAPPASGLTASAGAAPASTVTPAQSAPAPAANATAGFTGPGEAPAPKEGLLARYGDLLGLHHPAQPPTISQLYAPGEAASNAAGNFVQGQIGRTSPAQMSGESLPNRLKDLVGLHKPTVAPKLTDIVAGGPAAGKVAGAGVRAVTNPVNIGLSGAAIPAEGGNIAASIGRNAAANFLMGSSSQGAKEVGAPPIVQTGAGIASGLVPGLVEGGIKSVVSNIVKSGGEETAATIKQKAAAALGRELTADEAQYIDALPKGRLGNLAKEIPAASTSDIPGLSASAAMTPEQLRATQAASSAAVRKTGGQLKAEAQALGLPTIDANGRALSNAKMIDAIERYKLGQTAAANPVTTGPLSTLTTEMGHPPGVTPTLPSASGIEPRASTPVSAPEAAVPPVAAPPVSTAPRIPLWQRAQLTLPEPATVAAAKEQGYSSIEEALKARQAARDAIQAADNPAGFGASMSARQPGLMEAPYIAPTEGPKPPANPLTLQQQRLERSLQESGSNLGEGAPPAKPPSGGTGQAGFQGPDWTPGSGVSLPRKVINTFVDAFNAPRGLLASLDYSYPLRQGWLAMRHGKEWSQAFATGARAFFDDGLAQSTMARLQAGERGTLQITGLGDELNGREEAFMSRWINKVPGVRRSAQAATVFINKLRADVYDGIAASWDRRGVSYTPKDLDTLGNYINRMTGRGNLGNFEGAAQELATGLFSPRLLLSRVQAPGYMFSSSSLVRQEAVKDFLTVFGVTGGLIGLGKLAGAWDVELDPRSSDFGKMRIGQSRIDAWGGYQQLARFVAEVSTGQSKSLSGYVSDAALGDTVWRFVRSKMAPGTSFLVDVATGKDFVGNDINLAPENIKQQFYQRFMPLFMQDMIDGVKYEGARGALVTSPEFFGTGGYTIPDPQNTTARKQYGTNFAQLKPGQQAAINASIGDKVPDSVHLGAYYNASDAAFAKVKAENTAALGNYADLKTFEADLTQRITSAADAQGKALSTQEVQAAINKVENALGITDAERAYRTAAVAADPRIVSILQARYDSGDYSYPPSKSLSDLANLITTDPAAQQKVIDGLKQAGYE